MPCYDPGPDRFEEAVRLTDRLAENASLKRQLESSQERRDVLAFENDRYREYLLLFMEREPSLAELIPEHDRVNIRLDQQNHRMQDLRRLIDHFHEDPKMLDKLWSVDITKPLAPQIGFDPNSV